MASRFSRILGSIVITVSVGWFVFLALYSSLNPTTMGIGIVTALVGLWLFRDPDLTHPSEGSESSTSSGSPSRGSGSGPDLSGPSLDSTAGSPSGSGPGSSGGGSSGGSTTSSGDLKLEINAHDERGPLRAANIDIEVRCTDRSGVGLEALNVFIPSSGDRTGIRLRGVSSTIEHFTLEDVMKANPELKDTSIRIGAELFDSNRNSIKAFDVLKISNKNSGGKKSSMPDFPDDIEYLNKIESLLRHLEELDKKEIMEIEKMILLLEASEHAIEKAQNHLATAGKDKSKIPYEKVVQDFENAHVLLHEFRGEIGKLQDEEGKFQELEERANRAEKQIDNIIGNQLEDVDQRFRAEHDYSLKDRMDMDGAGKSREEKVKKAVKDLTGQDYPPTP